MMVVASNYPTVMSDYRRWKVPGAMYFLTVVTEGRRPLFRDEANRTLLGRVMREVAARKPFDVFAMVLLPDHLHTVWSMPRGDADYSQRWRQIKTLFTQGFLASGSEMPSTAARRKRHEHGVWKRRFYEHTVRDEDDLKRCVDYLHFNPVKHALVPRVRDWPWSSFHRFVALGEYDNDWGGSVDLFEDQYE
jgi:putative transposase